ncbi:hypothetical protein [Streptomyces indicus]|uniref:Uncharacterized protein n=1 Tax=Streptomyces indicus TaxID=417292 RepID=A0A1G9BH05_9ACTN|nr:hypothetical protein [Streptomyces indicus]SDK38145.1 hypothetical protein SAMN05421806_10728 [Streptomyces indicus]
MHRKQLLTVALSAALCGTLALGSAVSAAPKEPSPAAAGSDQEPPRLPPLPSLTTPPPAQPGGQEPAAAPSPTPWFTFPTFSWPPAPNASQQPGASQPAGQASGDPTPDPSQSPYPEFEGADLPGKRKALAKTWKTIGKFGNGAGDVADFAGTVLGGEKDPKVLLAAELKANASLDNLLGGFAGGPPRSDRAKAYRVLEGTIQALKAENKAIREAAAKGDLPGTAIHAGFSMMHMSFLAADVFVNIALSVVGQVLPFELPEFTFTPPKNANQAQNPQQNANPAQNPQQNASPAPNAGSGR